MSDTVGFRAASGALASAVSKLAVFDFIEWEGGETDLATPGSKIAVVYPGVWSTVPSRSGLASTAVLISMTVQCSILVATNPMRGVDLALANAVDALLAALNGDFDLGLDNAYVDVLAMAPASARAPSGLQVEWGWLPLGDGLMRACDVNVPIIVQDAYTQTQ